MKRHVRTLMTYIASGRLIYAAAVLCAVTLQCAPPPPPTPTPVSPLGGTHDRSNTEKRIAIVKYNVALKVRYI